VARPRVTSRTSGRPCPSVRRCSLVLNPPRLAPVPHPAGARPPIPVLTGGSMAGAGGVLVGTDHAAVHVVAQPVQLPTAISATVHLSQQPLEDPATAPAVQAAGHCLPTAIPTRGGRARARRCGPATPSPPRPAVLVVGPPGRRPLGRQQQLQRCPLGVGQLRFGSGHAPVPISPRTSPPWTLRTGPSSTP
jgi:hypothetical protein